MATLGELAKRFALDLRGDPAVEISGLCTLAPGEPGRLGFLGNPRYRNQLAATRATAVVLGASDAKNFQGNALIAKDPYLAYARIASLFDDSRRFAPGVHATAIVAPGVTVPPSSHIAALAVIEADVQLGERVYIGPGCVIGRAVRLGDDTRVEARAVLGERVRLGRRCRIQSGAVIGARGFGLARGPQGWEEVPQLGTVVLGDDVEVGANTTIDRGAIGDTVLEDGVKLDNQVQVAHNVHIGKHTAIAACVGIAGSVRIGARCMIGGGAGIAGHLEIADDIVILGWTMVTRSLSGPGQFSSGMPAQPAREWRRSVARLRRLGGLEERVAGVEQKLGIKRSGQRDEDDSDVG